MVGRATRLSRSQPSHLYSRPDRPGPIGSSKTRSIAPRAEAALEKGYEDVSKPAVTPRGSGKRKRPASWSNQKVGSDKRRQSLDKPGLAVKQEPEEIPSKKVVRAPRPPQNTDADANMVETSKMTPRKKSIAAYALALHDTPFPDYLRPSAAECREVHRLLTEVYGEMKPPVKIPEPSLVVAGCGLVPSVLDALIRTLLSSATNGRNSSAAVQGLARRFGVLKEGIGKGSIDWDAVRVAPIEDIFEAIKVGGLANNKSKNIKQLLDMVYEENQQRRAAVLSSSPSARTNQQSKDGKEAEVTKAEEHVLSLDYLHLLPDQELLEHLVRYPGVAHKTAKCVAMFCMGRNVFAVDTHIFRITKWLGWFPEGENNNAKAQAHMEVRIPDELKYPLHRLLIRHGQRCPRCIAGNHPGSKDWNEGCVLDHLVRRTGKNADGLIDVKEDTTIVGKKRRRRKLSGRRAKRRRYAESDTSETEPELTDNDDYYED